MAIFVGDTTYSETTINQNSALFGTSISLLGNLSVGTNLRASGQPSFVASGTVASWLYSTNFGGTGWREIGSQMGYTSTQVGSGFYNSTGRFTAQLAGHYYFYSQAYYYNDNNILRKNKKFKSDNYDYIIPNNLYYSPNSSNIFLLI
jgi:hypothetical protein